MGARCTLQVVAAVGFWRFAGSLLLLVSFGDLVSMYERDIVPGRRWMSSGKKKDLCLDVVTYGSDGVVVKHGWCCCCTKHPERTHVKLRIEASPEREEV
jgi:hypothetical protein